MELIIYSLVLLIVIVNSVFLFFLGVYLVRLSDRINLMMSDLIAIISQEPSVAPPTPSVAKKKPTTWDEKYEMELESVQRRLRIDSGLSDLPNSPSYDLPNK
jgi:hypothetical protein